MAHMITEFVNKPNNKTQQYNDWQSQTWQEQMQAAIRDPLLLLSLLELDQAHYLKQIEQQPKFNVLVPFSFLEKIKKGDWNDPLLRQVLSLDKENLIIEGYVSDPVGDKHAEIAPGLLKKYEGRALLLTTGACAIHCRYCFRQEFPYAESIPNKSNWINVLKALKQDNTLHEVILSGGDPLMLSNTQLSKMIEDISTIPHIKTLRFHTRIPVVLPDRVDQQFLQLVGTSSLNIVMVIHSNHVNELDDYAGNKLQMLNARNVILLNQAVLLKGVNDCIETQIALSKKLIAYQVMPYYLHVLDRVTGTAHFEVDKSTGLNLIDEMKSLLPGYFVPKFVQEVSGERSKLPIEKNTELC